jgi:hypothetical protein
MASEPLPSLTIVKQLRGERVSKLREWWFAVSRSGHRPTKSDFKLADWKKHLPWIAAVDPVRDTQGLLMDVSFKVFGSGLVRQFGGELTGKRLSDVGEPYMARWLAPVRVVEETKEPVAAAGNILIEERDFQEFEALFVPLFDSSGMIERFLVEAELLPWESQASQSPPT